MSAATLTLKDIQHLQAVQLIPAARRKKVLQIAESVTATAGSTILKKRGDATHCSFLLKGNVELRHSFSDRIPLSANDDIANQALEGLINTGCSIRALNECLLVRFNTALLEELQTPETNSHYEVVNLDEASNYLGDTMIDDDYQEDWTMQLLESPLARTLKPDDLRSLMSLLERTDVKSGDYIIRQGSRADFFYILLSGEAELTTDSNGPFKGSRIELLEGQHFGEEALLTDTLRNATIRMLSDGVIGCLTRDQFMEVFTDSLIPLADKATTAKLLDQSTSLCSRLDVRFKQEITGPDDKDLLNIPISRLRSSLPKLNRDITYLVTYEGGLRSELATCILRLHGFTAFLQESPEDQKTA